MGWLVVEKCPRGDGWNHNLSREVHSQRGWGLACQAGGTACTKESKVPSSTDGVRREVGKATRLEA